MQIFGRFVYVCTQHKKLCTYIKIMYFSIRKIETPKGNALKFPKMNTFYIKTSNSLNSPVIDSPKI